MALDVERISLQRSEGGGEYLSRRPSERPLGSNNGPGFGWRDVTAVKTGIAYEVTEEPDPAGGLQLQHPADPDSQTFFNVLAPAVIQHHVTAGVSWQFSA